MDLALHWINFWLIYFYVIVRKNGYLIAQVISCLFQIDMLLITFCCFHLRHTSPVFQIIWTQNTNLISPQKNVKTMTNTLLWINQFFVTWINSIYVYSKHIFSGVFRNVFTYKSQVQFSGTLFYRSFRICVSNKYLHQEIVFFEFIFLWQKIP